VSDDAPVRRSRTTLEPGDTVILHPNITCGLCPACRRGDDVRSWSPPDPDDVR
jgi:threonine dehydrogenase-like Zn-dependent dehydrogenase